ncbi:MAG: hypothetical protein ACREMA_18325 [Longimicrobiales bacterium]
MTADRNHPDDTEKLPEETVRRVLTRASELEAARANELSLAELRDVAREAGIAPSAVEQAIAELRGRNSLPDTEPTAAQPTRSGRFRSAVLGAGLLMAGLIMFFIIMRLLVS